MGASKIWGYVLLAAVLVSVVFFATRATPAKMSAAANPIEIRWLLAHQPAELFVRATKVFADELAKETKGSMTVKVLVPADVGFANGDVPTEKVFEFLRDGTAQLSSTYAVGIETRDAPFGVVNLPYLFKDYKSAGEVLDGPLGKQILETVAENTSARALAFTYSGGFRVIASKNKPIKTLSDFKGLRIGTAGGPVAEEIFRTLGAIPVSVTLPSAKKSLNAGDVDAVETTYTRLSLVLGSDTFIHYVSDTNHSLFLTAILADKTFYNSLSTEQQAALQKAAILAAKVEREDSVALADTTKIDAEKQGMTTVTLAPKDATDIQARLSSVYKKFEATFGAELIQKIVDAQK